MQSIKITVYLCFVICLLCSFAYADDANLISDSQQQEEVWELSTFLTFASGDFGTNTTTDFVYNPYTLTRYLPKGELSFCIPIVYINTDQDISTINGQPVQIGTSGGTKEKHSGIGDFTLGGSYYLWNEKTEPVNLSLIGKIKFPMADEDKNLGTGEFDQTLGLEASKTIDSEWMIFLDLYYKFVGDPPDVNYKNEFSFDIGTAYHLYASTWLSLFYEQSTALLSTQQDPKSLSFYVQQGLDNTTNVIAGLSIGLTNGSPDFSLTAGYNIKF